MSRWAAAALTVLVASSFVFGAAAKKRPAPQGSPKLEEQLDALALGLPPDAAAAMLDAVGETKNGLAFDVVAGYARHLDPALRVHAVAALAKLEDSRVAPALLLALGDPDGSVRAAAGKAAAARRERAAIPRLIALLKKGDAAAGAPLGALADADVARQVAELAGVAPDAGVAQALGAMLVRPDLGPESVYVGVVRALGTLPGDDTLVALTGFLGAVPKESTRQSVKEARAMYEQRVAR
jgi:HEAT repeat protein